MPVWLWLVIGILILAGVALSVTLLTRGGDPRLASEGPPDGQIVFVSKREGGANLFLVNADGTGLTRLSDDAMDDRLPAWSPDGAQVAFSRGSGFQYDIFVMDADGGQVRKLTDVAGFASAPTWSPDGSRIAFAADQGGDVSPFHDDIFVIGADGTALRRLTRGEGDEAQPAWSPVADEMLIVSSDPCPPELGECHEFEEGEAYLFLLSLDTGTAVRLTDRGQASGPAWSPDGTRVALAWDWEIWTMDPDGTDAVLVVPADGYRNFGPSWSPDGRWIAYVTDQDGPPGNEQVYVVAADGTRSIRLTDSRRADREPAWRP